MLEFTSAVRSETGPVREHNEDSGFAGSTLLMVADGVGGAAAGEIASASATYVVSAAALMEGNRVAAARLLERALVFAHRQIQRDAAGRPDRQGMATTATAILTDGSTAALAHVGDSRAYLRRGDRLRRLSRDDSLVQDLLDTGMLAAAAAQDYPYRNVITRCLGQPGDLQLSVSALQLRRGDRLMLCSDGVSDVLADAELACALDLDPAAAADRIVSRALADGSRDNVTCVVAEVTDDRTWTRPWGTTAGAGWNTSNLIDATAVRAAASVGPGPVLAFH